MLPPSHLSNVSLSSSSTSSSSSSDAVVVGLPPAGLGPPLGQEEGDGAQEAGHHQDEQLPVQQQVVAVEEGQGGHDGLRRNTEEETSRLSEIKTLVFARRRRK